MEEDFDYFSYLPVKKTQQNNYRPGWDDNN